MIGYNRGNEIECGSGALTPSRVAPKGQVSMRDDSTTPTPQRHSPSHVQVICTQCGVAFQRRRDRVKSRNFCSQKCVGLSLRKEGARWRDPDQVREYMRKYVQKNREKHNERSRAWNAANREQKAATRRAYRAGGSSADFTADDWESMKSQYNDRCLCCGRDDVSLSVDHIVPVAKGGEHVWDNIQPLCMDCNRRKGTQVIDYRPEDAG